jgi:hypothetical protein
MSYAALDIAHSLLLQANSEKNVPHELDIAKQTRELT